MKKQIISLILIMSVLFSGLFIATGCTETEKPDDKQDGTSEQTTNGGDPAQPGENPTDNIPATTEEYNYYEEVSSPEPLSYVPLGFEIPVDYDALSNELVQVGDKELDSLAFYVGQVLRAYGNETKLETIANLDDFITDTAVTSFNKELSLNYEKGFLIIDADKAQGITGFTKNAPTDFSDVIIDCGNEYASVVVVSMDNAKLADSGKILIQSMTEDKIYGFTTETVIQNKREKELITSLGGGMMQVKEIQATVTLKNITDGYAAVLDENGYVRELLDTVAGESGITIQIPKDAVYVIYSKTPLAVKDFGGSAGAYVWWEGEKYIGGTIPEEFRDGTPNPDLLDTNFPDYSWFSPGTVGGPNGDLEGDFSGLSEGNWLSISQNHRYETDAPPFAKYNIEAGANGSYSLYARVFWNHGPFQWKFDDNEWTQRLGTENLMDEYSVRTWLGANWIFLGEVELAAGTHTFEIQMTSPVSDDNFDSDGMFGYVGCFDAFLITLEPFVASGSVRPGDAKPDPEEGFFAFDPRYDMFSEDAALDLRWLNEEYAGQNGFVTSRNGNFYLGNGEEIRFWGVNTGHDTLYAGKGALDYMAQTLAKRGVNLIRIHGAIFHLDENRKAVIDYDKLEKLHYFVYAMKNAGIYTKLSTYFPLWHTFGSNTGYEAYDNQSNKNPFALLQFDRDFQAAYMFAVREMLETVSPYTGVALKDEPAVAFFEIENEDNYFFNTFNSGNIPNVHLKDLEKQFGDWLIAKYGTLEEANAAWDFASSRRDDFENGIVGLGDANSMIGTKSRYKWADGRRIADQIEFLTYSQSQFFLRIRNFVKDFIGSGSLIVPGNWVTANAANLEAIERYTYMAGDVTSRNGYFEPALHEGDDRVGYAVGEGQRFISQSGLFSLDTLPYKRVQNYGMPSMITEINYPNPNRFRAEFPIMLSAYSSLNGIDAPISFALGTSWELSISKFGIFTPVAVGQFPAAALMYRLGYVSEAGPVVLETLNINDLYQFQGSFINEYISLDLFRQQN